MNEKRLEAIDLNIEEPEIETEESQTEAVQTEELQAGATETEASETEVSETEAPQKKKNNIVSTLLILVGLICMVVSICGLYGIYREYKEAADIYKEAENKYVQKYEQENEALTEIDTEFATEELGTEIEVPKVPWYQLATVDLKALQQDYAEIVGWIFFEDGLISYPVMQAEDNDKYLHTTYNGKESKSGSIYVDATNSGDFSDTHTIIYGHNMKNLSMFGRLKHYKTQAGYYFGHEYFQIFCGDEILRYQIFAYRDVEVGSSVYEETYTSARLLSYELLRASYVNPKLDIEDDDKIITLSTCTADEEHRFIVSAVLVERYNVVDGTLTVELDKSVEE